MHTLDNPLTNLQLELLKLYSLNVTDEQILDIRRLIAKYFADKAADEMDRLWEERGWTKETMEEWLRDPEEGTTDEQREAGR